MSIRKPHHDGRRSSDFGGQESPTNISPTGSKEQQQKPPQRIVIFPNNLRHQQGEQTQRKRPHSRRSAGQDFIATLLPNVLGRIQATPASCRARIRQDGHHRNYGERRAYGTPPMAFESNSKV
jgi:hypothetical protein